MSDSMAARGAGRFGSDFIVLLYWATMSNVVVGVEVEGCLGCAMVSGYAVGFVSVLSETRERASWPFELRFSIVTQLSIALKRGLARIFVAPQA